MIPSLFRYTWNHTRPQQIWILCVVLASLPTYFLSLELPKRIVNGPIQGEGFETAGDTRTFLEIAFNVPTWLADSGRLELFGGFDLDRYGTLFALSAMFLLLVIVNGLFKFYINTYKGLLGERMLRRLRFELMDKVLRFPPTHFRRVKSSEVASMVKDEVEPLGGFIGDAFAQPLFLAGQALTAMAFILVQNVWLGMIAISIIAIQMFIIPQLRRRLIVLGKQRQLTARELSGRVGEVVDSIHEVHVNDTSNYERADVTARLGRIFEIRYELYRRKFFVKFLNNFLAQITPFLFYAVGGYFALQGKLDIGQLVAVIAAYKDLPSPIKELIDWDQQRLDVEVKFNQVMNQFAVDGSLDAALQAPVTTPIAALSGPIRVSNLTVTDDTDARLIERASLELAPGERVAIVGPVNSGGEVVAEVLARLQPVSGGRVTIGDASLFDLPQAVTGRRLSYAGADTALPQGSIRDVLFYVLKHAPMRQRENADADPGLRRYLAEAGRTGNAVLDPQADWIDYEGAGAANAGELLGRAKRILRLVSLLDDLVDFGLRGTVDPTAYPELTERIVEVRRTFHKRLAEAGQSQLVEMFDPTRYCTQATLAENLLFGAPVGAREFDLAQLMDTPYLGALLAQTALDHTLFEMGRTIAETSIELFQDLPPDHPFFERLSFMAAEEIPDYQAVLKRLQNVGFAEAAPEDRRMLVRLTSAYIEPRHRLGLLDPVLMQRIVAARAALREGLPDAYRDRIEFYDPGRYIRAASLQDNILMGRISQSVSNAKDKASKLLRQLLEDLGLEDAVFELGLGFDVGAGGKRLTAVQRQKLGIARALIKRPDYAIFNRPLPALDLASQRQIVKRVLEEAAGADGKPFGVLWVVSHNQLSSEFDRVVVFDRGAVVEHGQPQTLLASESAYARLMA